MNPKVQLNGKTFTNTHLENLNGDLFPNANQYNYAKCQANPSKSAM